MTRWALEEGGTCEGTIRVCCTAFDHLCTRVGFKIEALLGNAQLNVVPK